MLEMKDISYTYKGKGNRQILTDINMTFEEGKFYVIVGTSGSGKTTLLSLLAGLDEPQSGQIPVSYTHLDVYKRQIHIDQIRYKPYKNKC